jgi:hypothetical protein
MPGFAVQSQSSASEGFAKGYYVKNVGVTPTLLFTAGKKTRITNVTANNVEGGILPITLFVRRDNVDTVVIESRVFKQKALVMSLVDQDPRVGADKMTDLPHTEIVLLPGDALYAMSPLNNSFDININLFEGIS